MILFVTMRAHALDIDRRLRSFANLRLEVRHLRLAEGAFAEFRGPVTLAHVVHRLWNLLVGIFHLRDTLRSLSDSDLIFVNALDCLFAALVARMLHPNRCRLVCQILDVHPYLLERSPVRPILRFVERRMLSKIDLLIVPTAVWQISAASS